MNHGSQTALPVARFDSLPRTTIWSRTGPGNQQLAETSSAAPGRSRERLALMVAAAEARSALRAAATAAAEAAAQAQSMAAILDEALAALDGAAAPARPRRLGDDAAPALQTLSAREREVLVLVAEGRSNKAIADALYVSPNTVKTHVASLLSKLQVQSRAQLAAIAARLPAPSANDGAFNSG